MNVWTEAILDLFYPADEIPEKLPRLEAPFCERCCEPYDGAITSDFVCPNCQGRDWHLEKGRAAFRSEGFVRETIHEFKYNGQFHHLPLLTDWLEEGFVRHYTGENFTALVPVPLHPSRRRSRGFNQAMELAQMLGKRVGLPVKDCLERIKPTETQTHLTRAQRLKNLSMAFALKRGFDVTGEALLVLDDVFTTGTTVDSCAKVILHAKAARVCALTVARG